MAKFYRPKLNSWLMTLGLVSIGLHGLVLALPMPNLVEPPPPAEEELPDPEVIQVVTLPKLATAPESIEPPIPEPPEDVPPPIEEPVEDIVLTDPDILDEPEFFEELPDGGDDLNTDDDSGIQTDTGDGLDDQGQPPSLEQRMANRNSYSNFDGTRIGAGPARERLMAISIESGKIPSKLGNLQRDVPPIVVPLQECLDNRPGDSVSIMAQLSPEGLLIGEPELLNSTGYEVLDEKALAVAREVDYSPYYDPDKSEEYISFSIKVDYEACDFASRLTDTQASG